MRTLVIYDTFFGNTEKVALAIGEALGPRCAPEVVRVSDFDRGQLPGAELLIVGSPTRAFKPTQGITSFLKNLAQGALRGVRVAAFDTRMNPAEVNSRVLSLFVWALGYAAKPIADRLQSKGGTLVAPPEGFFVSGSEGPLKDGELARAAKWAESLAGKQ